MPSTTEEEILDRASVPGWKLRFPRRFLRAIAPFWVLGLIAGSFLPTPMKERLGTTTNVHVAEKLPHVALRHRLYHLASFGSTAFLFLILADTRRDERRGAGFVLLLGCAIETLQSLQPNAVFEWWDVLDDFYAIAGVFIVTRILNQISAKREADRTI